ncbi:MAG: hypothetical protein PWQ25_458 [Deferribacteres bacterium]|jgi:hypothetical protein|nr:hypothetical protein [Deferribacteres bacterium]
MLSIENVLNNLALLPKYLEQEEIRNKLIEAGEEVAPKLYQVRCHYGRYQTIKDTFEFINIENPQCWGCPIALAGKKGVKACFNLLTTLDTERWYSKKICPTSLKARALLLYGKWDDPFEISERLKKEKRKTG